MNIILKKTYHSNLKIHNRLTHNLFLIMLTLTIFQIIFINPSYAQYTGNITRNKNLEVKLNNNSKNTSDVFFNTKKMNYKHKKLETILLPNNNVLILDYDKCEIYSPQQKIYTVNKTLFGGQVSKFAYLMNDNKVLIISESRTQSVPYIGLYDYLKNVQINLKDKLPNKLKDYIRVFVLSPNLILFHNGYNYYAYNLDNNSYITIDGSLLHPTDRITTYFYKEKNEIILLSPLTNSVGYNIIKYDDKKNTFNIIDTIKFKEGLYGTIKFYKEKIYFLMGNNILVDDTKSREGIHPSPIYEYNLNLKEFKRNGYLSNGGNVESVVLKDGRIMLNSGRFYGPFYIQYEIYNPETKKSSFTIRRKWYKETKMTLLNDGSVLFSGGYYDPADWSLGTNESFIYYPDYENKEKNSYDFSPPYEENTRPTLNEIQLEIQKKSM